MRLVVIGLIWLVHPIDDNNVNKLLNINQWTSQHLCDYLTSRNRTCKSMSMMPAVPLCYRQWKFGGVSIIFASFKSFWLLSRTLNFCLPSPTVDNDDDTWYAELAELSVMIWMTSRGSWRATRATTIQQQVEVRRSPATSDAFWRRLVLRGRRSTSSIPGSFWCGRCSIWN